MPILGPFLGKVFRVKLFRVRTPDVLPAVQRVKVHQEDVSRRDLHPVEFDFRHIFTGHIRRHRTVPETFVEEHVQVHQLLYGFRVQVDVIGWYELHDFLVQPLLDVLVEAHEEDSVSHQQAGGVVGLK